MKIKFIDIYHKFLNRFLVNPEDESFAAIVEYFNFIRFRKSLKEKLQKAIVKEDDRDIIMVRIIHNEIGEYIGESAPFIVKSLNDDYIELIDPEDTDETKNYSLSFNYGFDLKSDLMDNSKYQEIDFKDISFNLHTIMKPIELVISYAKCYKKFLVSTSKEVYKERLAREKYTPFIFMSELKQRLEDSSQYEIDKSNKSAGKLDVYGYINARLFGSDRKIKLHISESTYPYMKLTILPSELLILGMSAKDMQNLQVIVDYRIEQKEDDVELADVSLILTY